MTRRGKRGPVSTRLISDMELYVLAREGVVTITLEELNSLPLETVQHLLGFATGRRELEEESQQKQAREARKRRVGRFG